MQQITVEIQNKYGKEYIYPACSNAFIFCQLLGEQKTLTRKDISFIKELGYEVKVKPLAAIAL